MSEANGRQPIGVIVVTFDSERVLPGLLASLEAGMEGVEWRGVVVDNGSSDRTVELARAYGGDLRVIEAEANRGFAAAVNRGLADLGTEDVLILNPDIRLSGGTAAGLRRRLAAELRRRHEPARRDRRPAAGRRRRPALALAATRALDRARAGGDGARRAARRSAGLGRDDPRSRRLPGAHDRRLGIGRLAAGLTGDPG